MKDPRPPSPLRAIVSESCNEVTGQVMETLECGHVVPRRTDIFGETYAVRRRCRRCAAELRSAHLLPTGEVGHFLDGEQ